MKYPAVTAYILHILATDAFLKNKTPTEINNGQCEEFASLLEDKFPNGDMLWGDEIPEKFNADIYEPSFHCFFQYQGEDCEGKAIFYDAECPNGVASPVELPFYKRQRQRILKRRQLLIDKSIII